MIILSHRGYWLGIEEKNSIEAFHRSFSLGYGTETDIRDYNGSLVISHDIPSAHNKHISVDEFFEIYKSYNSDLPLALNIKSDGLQLLLDQKIKQYDITNYFVFDMSVPDALVYLKNNITAFTRHSEYETIPSFYKQAEGVWLDEFNDPWINIEVLAEHIQNDKKICIVSPELHQRSYQSEWTKYKDISTKLQYNNMMICTDLPEKAQLFFNGN